MDKVQDSLLYTDTDSLLFYHKKGENPLESLIGPKMGQLASEIEPGWIMKAFVCIAPKAYAYRLELQDGSKSQDTVKAKGLTLDFQNKEKVKFDSMKNLLDNFYEMEPATIATERTEIVRKLGKISTKSRTKEVRIVHNKSRVLFGDLKYHTEPYGFSKNMSIINDYY